MISLPNEIQADTAWDGRTGLDKHLDSSMDFEEHQRIAFNALQLLAGQLDVDENAAGEKLKKLKDAYEGGDPDDVLYISKGIHQPETNPHMQLKLKRGKNDSTTYHLNVSVYDQDIPGLPERYFHWVGVQFTAEASDGKVKACWPKVAVHDTKYKNRRRMSIAPKDVQGTIEAIARATRLEQERANKVEQARLAESDRAKKRNVITAQLAANNWTIVGNKTTVLNKMIEGETAEVTTKTRKTIKVKFDGGKLKQA